MQGDAGSGQVKHPKGISSPVGSLARVLSLVAFAGTAQADSIKPPAGWTADGAAAVSLTKKLGDVPHFGGLRAVVTTEVFRTQGATLFMTRATATIAGLDGPNRDKAATTEGHELLRAMMRSGGKPYSDLSRSSDENAKTIEMTQRWHDEITKVATHSRIVIAADAQQMIAVTGECLLAADVTKDVDAACTAALATIDPGIPLEGRVRLTISKEAGPVIQPPPSGAGSTSGPSLVDSGERPSLPPMQFPQEREPDRRPIYVGLGLIVLAVVFYLNRKNREKLEREYEKRTADKPEPTAQEPVKAKPRDGDADDLHAAAADDDTKGSKP